MDFADYSHLESFFDQAVEEAKKSPCVRRQYGALTSYVYVDGDGPTNMVTKECNSRISKVCDGFCVRTRQGITSGNHVLTELGGEIHAEAAVLLRTTYHGNGLFILVGFIGDHELLGEDAYPCLWCAKLIKFAGYKHIFLRDKNREIRPYSIAAIIEELEEYDVA